MPIELLGMIATTAGSETKSVTGPVIDPAYVTEFSRAHEDAGFDRILIGYSASSPDGFAVAAAALHATQRLKVLIAHRPGFVAPTLVARKLATPTSRAGDASRSITSPAAARLISAATATSARRPTGTVAPGSSSTCCVGRSRRASPSITTASSIASKGRTHR